MPRQHEQRYRDPARPYPIARQLENEPPFWYFAYRSSRERWLDEHWWIRPPDFPGEEPPLDQTTYWNMLEDQRRNQT